MANHPFLCVIFLKLIFTVVYVYTDDKISFPKDFLFGVATSSYQIEGAWNEDGKGENVWDQWTREHPTFVTDHSNGNVACDSYHKYKEDVQLLKNIGVNFYRFSLSWARILPNGYANVINQKGLDYYKELIDLLLANDIEPLITLYHWDHPEVFEKMGGWTNEMMVDWMSDYARVVFRELGPKVKYFITINEPSVICNLAYATDYLAPGKNLHDYGRFLCMHNILKTHARIYHIYDTEFRKQQNGQISIIAPCAGAFSKYSNDTTAVDAYFQFSCGWITHPIYSKTGNYPKIMRTQIAENSKLAGYPTSLLPKFSSKWVQYIRGTADFFALNHYTSRLVETVPRKKEKPWYNYSGVKEIIDPSWPASASDWLKVVPSGFRQILNKISKEYDYPQIFVLENGYSDTCCFISDYRRISYLHSYMAAILSAIHEDGCNVMGYAVWSLLDNFEWRSGYTQRFGLVNVNFTDPARTRTPKWSMKWYENVVKSRKLQSTLNFLNV